MKAVNSRIIHQLFVHLSFEILRSRNFFGHNNESTFTSKRKYKLAICNVSIPFLLSFVRDLCSKPHINWNWQSFPYSDLQRWKAQTYWTIGFKQFVSQIVQNLGLRQLSCVQAACLIPHSVNVRNELSTIGWQRLLNSKSSDLTNPNAQAFNLGLGELHDIVYARRPMEGSTPTTLWSKSHALPLS